MNQANILDKPKLYSRIEKKSAEIGFTMPSDVYIGTLLRTLISSKPKSNILELGTGIGLSLSWMIDGLDNESRLTTIDNDLELINIAKGFFCQIQELRSFAKMDRSGSRIMRESSLIWYLQMLGLENTVILTTS